MNAKMQPTPLKVAQENWQVLIPEAHAGYITWEEFGHNQLTLRRNAGGFGNGRRGSVPREGAGLLQGRVLCGFCGARMRVRYQKVGGKMEPYYQCAEASVRHAGTLCQSVRGSHIDKAIEALLLELVATPALEAALAVQQEITNRISEADTLRQTRLERARYEAELSRRRFFAVDPSNRLVADTLEADWNEQLRQLDDLQQEQNRQRDADKDLLSEEARSAVLKLAKDFSCVWSDERTTSIERKRMVADREISLIGDADDLANHINDYPEWNTFRVVARGFIIQQYINGKLMCEFHGEDEDTRRSAGLLALQLHAGKPMGSPQVGMTTQ